MDDLQVQRYSGEVKVYIAATVVLAVLIVGLIWWNNAKETQRSNELNGLYAAYQELGNHINQNISLDNFAACTAPSRPEQPAAVEGEEPNEEAVKASEAKYQQMLAMQTEKAKTFTNEVTQQYSYLNQQKPTEISPELMTDATLFRLNKTYNEFTASLQKLTERCGELSPEQVQMRKNRYDKALARFTANLKDLERPVQ
jgi:hypothetical protein